MTIEKKETELTEFLKSIPEDPMPEEMWEDAPCATTVYDADGNILEEREVIDDGYHGETVKKQNQGTSCGDVYKIPG